MRLCERCFVRAASGKPWRWKPELCNACVAEIKHPTMRDGPSDWMAPEQCQSAHQMLAELRQFQIPPDWLADAAEVVAGRSGESVEDVLQRWNEDRP